MEMMGMFWPHVLGCTGYENTTILHSLVLLSHTGSDVYELLWKLILLAAFWGVCSFLLFVWRTVLVVKPPMFQVTLKQMTEKIKNFEKENKELEENVSSWEQKTNNAKKCLEAIRQKKMLSEEALKFKENLKIIKRKSEYLNDIIQIARAKLQAARDQNAKSPHLPRVLKTRSEDTMQRAETTEDCSLEELEKKMQDHHATSGSVTGEEANFQRLEQRICFPNNISGQTDGHIEEKVDMKGCELVEKQQLLAAEEKAKLAEDETRQYKRRLEECHRQMQGADIALRLQITRAKKKSQDNWIRARELERENTELRREAAHLKQRLDAICIQRQAEKYMRQEPTPGGPYRLHPSLRPSGPGGAPVRNGSDFRAQEAEETQDYGPRRGPRTIPAPWEDFYPWGCPPEPFIRYRPLAPRRPTCLLGPYPQPISPVIAHARPGVALALASSSYPHAVAQDAQNVL
ncbi:transport and Golgi organization protein 1 homolog [Vicugna pacos]|uniref:Transport and Golgi organization protein 1 homolog n=1 Tax=Vicugna pacos TaxID=30538 RepID=A0ABM5CSJ4_VICPA